jgi:hypothetical protein
MADGMAALAAAAANDAKPNQAVMEGVEEAERFLRRKVNDSAVQLKIGLKMRSKNG